MPGTFYYWMLNIVNFIMSSVQYFCFPLTILEFCFGTKSDLKTIRLFQILFLIFVRQNQRHVHSQATYSHYWGNNLLCSLLGTAWILRFSSWAGRNGHYFRLCVKCQTLLPWVWSGGSFPKLRWILHVHEQLGIRLDTWGNPPHESKVLSVQCSLLQYSDLQTNLLCHLWLSLGSPSTSSWKLSRE